MKKIGVFVCHCGINIASTVDVKKVAEEMSKKSLKKVRAFSWPKNANKILQVYRGALK